MRSEVLYQYDLPVELLDEIPRTEEVLEVLFARSKEKWLVPILITRERIVWAYPEMATVYRIYEMQYVDLKSVYVKFALPPLSSSLSFETVNGQKYVFSSLKEGKDEIRGALLTLLSEMNRRFGDVWGLSGRKTFMTDEFRLDKNQHPESETISSGASALKFHDSPLQDDVFEDEKSVPGKGCFESNEVLFSHFAKEGEDVFEETKVPAAESSKEDPYADADKKVARMVETVEADIAESRRYSEDADTSVPAPKREDCVVYGPNTGAVNDQWEEHKGGDALILSNPVRFKVNPPEKKPEPEYGPEDDDSIVYPSSGAANAGNPAAADTKPVREYGPEDDDSVVYPSADDEIVITPFRPDAKASQAEADDKISVPSKPVSGDSSAGDEVVLTPFRRPKPEFVSLTDESQVPVDSLQKPAADGKEPEMEIASLQRPAYEVDDHVVVSPVKKSAPEEEAESVVLRNQPDAGKRITPSPLRKAVTLEPAERFNPAEVEKLLDELKHLRDSGIITEKEYRERSLKLFKEE
ncbi:MAG TPA: hypothetical protein O0X97_06255 [Methanocorpusculum sp.]|nr:hypothetical protein [Methanocorpusculum sp.]